MGGLNSGVAGGWRWAGSSFLGISWEYVGGSWCGLLSGGFASHGAQETMGQHNDVISQTRPPAGSKNCPGFPNVVMGVILGGSIFGCFRGSGLSFCKDLRDANAQDPRWQPCRSPASRCSHVWTSRTDVVSFVACRALALTPSHTRFAFLLLGTLLFIITVHHYC